MKIAVIGSGISGASLAFMLSSAGHQVEVFEREAHAGIDAHSISVGNLRVDVPVRSISPSYYPNLCALYKQAGVQLEPWIWNYSVSLFQSASSYKGELLRVSSYRFGGYRIPSLSGWWRWLYPSTYLLLFESFQFFCSVMEDVDDPKYERMTLRNYTDEKKCSQEFIYAVLLPLLSMICTCSYSSLWRYPVDVLLEYLVVIHSPASQLRTRFGTIDAAQRLLRDCKLRCSTQVLSVTHSNSKTGALAGVSYVDVDGAEVLEGFDEVVLATQPQTALRLLKDPSKQQIEALSLFKQEHTTVVVHRDPDLMPKHAQWATVNCIVRNDENNGVDVSDDASSMFSMWASKTSAKTGVDNTAETNPVEDFFLTWNPLRPARESAVLAKAHFERPLVQLDSRRAVNLLRNIQGIRNIWFAGSYATYALPLQESCVNSALFVARSLGCEVKLDAESSGELGDCKDAAATPLPLWLSVVFVSASVLSASIVAKSLF